MALQIQTAADGVVRDAHYVIPTGASEPVRTLLGEPQRTNLLTNSQDFASWINVSSCNVTTNAAIAPDGTPTADLLTATVGGSRRRRDFSLATDGTKCAFVFVKNVNSSLSRLWYADNTDTQLHRLTVSWSGPIPTVTTNTGAGIIYPVEYYGDGWYKISWAATGVIAANGGRINIQPDPNTGVGSILVWGAQAEDAVTPTSYTPTAGSAVVRNADVLYWENALLVPQEMTAYARLVNVGAFAATGTRRRILHIGGANAGVGVRLQLNCSGGGSGDRLEVLYTDNTTQVVQSATSSPTIAQNDIVEMRGVLNLNWTVSAGVSVNNAAEVAAGPSAASGPAAAFGGTRLYAFGATGLTDGSVAYTHIGVFRGTHDRAFCRAATGLV